MLERYKKAKVECMRYYAACWSTKAKEFWAKRVAWCDKKIAQNQTRQRELKRRIRNMVITVNLLAIISILVFGCGTVDGMRKDIHNLTRSPYTQEME
jgi:predicted small secreted protein